MPLWCRTATVACNPALRTKLAGVPASGAPVGYYAGFVVGQNPAGNTGANIGTVVTLSVSKSPGIGMVAVPNLIGLTGPQADAALAAVGLGSNGSSVVNFNKSFIAPGCFSIISPNLLAIHSLTFGCLLSAASFASE